MIPAGLSCRLSDKSITPNGLSLTFYFLLLFKLKVLPMLYKRVCVICVLLKKSGVLYCCVVFLCYIFLCVEFSCYIFLREEFLCCIFLCVEFSCYIFGVVFFRV